MENISKKSYFSLIGNCFSDRSRNILLFLKRQ
ncbi:MAG: hypothetical protein MRERV_24c010 [Mycoplasmataceae bacterium RV_VA103A]|nr:MAG: hypothetical protein MRERV_24c010 [Mycoplasmataceae bacterium RV_VA103A]